MQHIHRWGLESCLQSRPSILRGNRWENGLLTSTMADIDGELYTVRNTRGNIEGVCACSEERTFHPFTGGVSLAGADAPPGDLLERTIIEEVGLEEYMAWA